MPRPDALDRATVIALHDVSPATWRDCRELLAMLDDAGATPLTLLVIPDHHHRAPVEKDRAFVRALETRLERGDELVLHGFHHLDESPSPSTPVAWFERRMLTRSEGEFAAIDREQAAQRLSRGVAMFRALGWPLHGFVPPAWMMGEGARAALAACDHPFEYATVRRGIHHLPEWRFERTATLWYSPDTLVRRFVSRVAISHELSRARALPLLRLALHPPDARVPTVRDHWQRLIASALRGRTPVTKRAWVRRFRQRGEPRPRDVTLPADERAPGSPHADASPARAAS
jgi:predicted deacetylase